MSLHEACCPHQKGKRESITKKIPVCSWWQSLDVAATSQGRVRIACNHEKLGQGKAPPLKPQSMALPTPSFCTSNLHELREHKCCCNQVP